MSPISRWLSRALDGVDALFDSLSSLRRVLLRGAFEADPKSFRGLQFVSLVPEELLVQPLTLNAADVAEAKRVVALEPERYLPLSSEGVTFDLAGPIGTEEPKTTEAAQTYLLGVTRRETLEAVRGDARKALFVGVEAFTYQPPNYPEMVLVFRDAAGDRARRKRRWLSMVAAGALLWTGLEAASAWRESLERSVLEAENQRMQLQRRIRIAQKRVQEQEERIAALEDEVAVSLPSVLQPIATLARRLPADSELKDLVWAGRVLDLQGRSFNPGAMELELRRGFEHALVTFESQAGAPSTFTASLTFSEPSAAKRTAAAAQSGVSR